MKFTGVINRKMFLKYGDVSLNGFDEFSSPEEAYDEFGKLGIKGEFEVVNCYKGKIVPGCGMQRLNDGSGCGIGKNCSINGACKLCTFNNEEGYTHDLYRQIESIEIVIGLSAFHIEAADAIRLIGKSRLALYRTDIQKKYFDLRLPIEHEKTLEICAYLDDVMRGHVADEHKILEVYNAYWRSNSDPVIDEEELGSDDD